MSMSMIDTIRVMVIGCITVVMAQTGMSAGNELPTQTQTKTTTAKDKPQTSFQTNCPVMGGAVDKNLYVDHDGKRIFACCPACLDKIKEDPAKYITKLEDAGVTMARVQTVCPVMGGKINKELYVDHDGKRIYVCCQACIAAVKANPEKYIKKLEGEGIAPDPAGKVKQEVKETQGADATKKEHHH